MIETLISEYRELAALHGSATLEGNSRKANQAHKKLHETLQQIAALGKDRALISLFDDDDASVQLWAAAHSLETDEEIAIAKLQSLEKTEVSIIGMSAKYTIQEWNSGVSDALITRLLCSSKAAVL